MVEKNIKINMPKEVKYIIDILEEHGYEAYAVGGCIRDSLLNRIPHDWDITTDAKGEQVIKIFKSLDFNVVKTGIRYGTVTLIINSIGYEITTYRIDGNYLDGRHPEKVEFTNNLKEDLSRRDFTVNAMAYNHKKGLADYYNGREDLKNKIIKSVGDPLKRFSEDALRMIRGVRFSAQLDFNIEENTKEAIKKLSSNIKNVSVERIREEFNKILLSSNTYKIKELEEYGLLKNFLPEYAFTKRIVQNNQYHIYNLEEHLICSIENVDKKLHLRLTMLLHDIGKSQCKTTDNKGVDHFCGHEKISSEMAGSILRRLKYDNKTIDKVTSLIKYHHYPIENKRNIKKLLNKIGLELFRDLLKVKEGDIKAQNPMFFKKRYESILEGKKVLEEILKDKECFTLKDLAINGKDLIDLGYKDGRNIGKTLNTLLELVLEKPELNKKEELIKYIKKEES
ncbi:polynucleotide adenylyltransferase [Clostridium tetani]|uniref:CCA tRNA nucleotidyltransferase n=1 Tax=Clostridium tetani TaxID=1513 RepID=UPI000512AF00|nr:HD domain-containing protein [Clostridium tetani]AVP53656.1 HD domain-containing protein [Clostridium tetani]KGI41715.1 polynucleotide adenylyltransferase [Clostridium tetani]RXI69243.1 HD domain-containing protein [Clostridium tetani]RXI75503.1 HD domain-containing protein [Clostridium tetani]WFN63034.1 HD domain-containing protein [Clostridium tetani]